MMVSASKKIFLQKFFHIAFSLLFTIYLIRIFEYFAIASKLFVDNAYRFEIAGLFYDTWLWLIYCFVIFWLYRLLYLLNKSLANILFHSVNIIFILVYLALLITFSERTTPFDHEFFTRNAKDTFLTVKQMMTSGIYLYLPFIVYLFLYFIFYFKPAKKISVPTPLLLFIIVSATAAISLVKYSNPSPDWFAQNSGYYLVCNKLSYWLHDSYNYLILKDHHKTHQLNDKELEKEIIFYQNNQPFAFTSNEYPLMHKADSNDVLGHFFNLTKTPPNIVILVIEGLSRDFSGEKAYAGSFTPFLDSLSNKSLVWDNFLSTAPGTFAAHPAISGSLPYGKLGFSIMNIMPDHLSLIKILRANGYFTNFMIGFNPDFDNMGGYIRMQGTDFILTKYGPQYKKMGVGDQGWSMGYPDDALFSRSLEVMDSIHKTPYLSIYHTGTTHLPYLFEQKQQYESLFDKKISTMAVSPAIKRTLKKTKNVLVTFMFADDCLQKFFTDYSKRPDFDNTIFLITGDHHIGSFPSTGEIDDYHVPFIIYSPMLKNAQRFLSVNSHNNITPTILSLLSKNFNLAYDPKEVHWLGSVIDTCRSFRNIQSMPFMSWSREINDYLYKDYFISDDQLYKLTPELLQVKYKNDSIKNHLIHLRENFKLINNYVCENNKIYPSQHDLLTGNKQLLLEYDDSTAKTIFSKKSDTSLMKDLKVHKEFKYLYIEFSGSVNLPSPVTDNNPTIRFALINTEGNDRNYLVWSKRDIATLSKGDFMPQQWNSISANDIFALDDYKNIKDLNFEVAIYTDFVPINLKIQKCKVRIYGIK